MLDVLCWGSLQGMRFCRDLALAAAYTHYKDADEAEPGLRKALQELSSRHSMSATASSHPSCSKPWERVKGSICSWRVPIFALRAG